MKALRETCGGGSKLIKKGSRSKGTAIAGSDFDYQIQTSLPMSVEDRDRLLKKAQKVGLKITCSKALTVKPSDGGRSIDFFPPKAEWHDGVVAQSPYQPPMDEGRKCAIRKLKLLQQKMEKKNQHWADIKSFQIEQLVLRVQQDHNFTSKTDPAGEKRFSEAQRRISGGIWVAVKELKLSYHNGYRV